MQFDQLFKLTLIYPQEEEGIIIIWGLVKAKNNPKQTPKPSSLCESLMF